MKKNLLGIVQEKIKSDIKEASGKEPYKEPRVGSVVKLGLLITDVSTKSKDQKVTQRVQYFQGVVIAASGSGLSRNITVRRIASNYIGVERIVPLYSPNLVSLEVIKEQKVRRAKLYYIRDRKGKAAMSV